MAEPQDDDFDPTAGELALGVLDGPAHAAARARAERDSAFAADVAAWERRLAPLALAAAPVEPPPSVWRRIAIQLGVDPAAGRRPPRMIERVGFWRAVAGVSAAAAAACLALLVLAPRPQPPAPPAPASPAPMAVARLQEEGGTAVFIAALDPATHRLVVAPATVAASPVHSHELWLLPASGPPRSLGIVYADRSLTLTAPEDLAAGAALAVTAEPLGGSPTGLPTGPVVAQGRLAS